MRKLTHGDKRGRDTAPTKSKKQFKKRAATMRRCLARSDAARAPANDETAQVVQDEDVTDTRMLNPLLICTSAYATGVQLRTREEPPVVNYEPNPKQLTFTCAAFIRCMIMHEIIMCAATVAYVYDHATSDVDVGAADQVRTQKTWRERVREAQYIIRNMLPVNKGFTVDSGAAAHVMPRGWIAWLMVLASWGSRNGVH